MSTGTGSVVPAAGEGAGLALVGGGSLVTISASIEPAAGTGEGLSMVGAVFVPKMLRQLNQIVHGERILSSPYVEVAVVVPPTPPSSGSTHVYGGRWNQLPPQGDPLLDDPLLPLVIEKWEAIEAANLRDEAARRAKSGAESGSSGEAFEKASNSIPGVPDAGSQAASAAAEIAAAELARISRIRGDEAALLLAIADLI